MKTKVVQHVPRINLSYFKFQNFKFSNFLKFSLVPSFCLTFRHFFDSIIIIISSSTLSCEFTDHRAGSVLKISANSKSPPHQPLLHFLPVISSMFDLSIQGLGSRVSGSSKTFVSNVSLVWYGP